MISTWSEWKRYPRAGRGENMKRRFLRASTKFATLHGCAALIWRGRQCRSALALLSVGSKSWFGRREPLGKRRISNIAPVRLPQSRRQGRGGSYDRPPRDLYERRGLNGPQFRLLVIAATCGGWQPLNLLDAAALLRAVALRPFRPIINFNKQNPTKIPRSNAMTRPLPHAHRTLHAIAA